MMIADLHAITVPQIPAELKETILLTAATYLACGVDLQRTIMFQQSAVPAHSELAWILGSVAKMGELERMIQYKDKVTIKGESVSVGLFNYPVLMAADILLYQIEAVPVGVDQKQHLELTRALAERFNKDFGPAFLLPKPLISKEAAKIMGLDDPSIKMSKSAPNPKNYLGLLDSADEIATKIKAAVTDSEPTITADPNRAGVYNLLTIFSLASKRSIDSIGTTLPHFSHLRVVASLGDCRKHFVAKDRFRVGNAPTAEKLLEASAQEIKPFVEQPDVLIGASRSI